MVKDFVRVKKTKWLFWKKVRFGKQILKIYSFRNLVDTIEQSTDHLGKCHLHLEHGVVEVHVLQQFDGGEEEQDREKGDEVLSGRVDLVEARVFVLDLDQPSQLTVHSDVTVDEETDGDVAQLKRKQEVRFHNNKLQDKIKRVIRSLNANVGKEIIPKLKKYPLPQKILNLLTSRHQFFDCLNHR